MSLFCAPAAYKGHLTADTHFDLNPKIFKKKAYKGQ